MNSYFFKQQGVNMKKSIFTLVLALVAFSASAVDLSISNGRDYKVDKDYVKAALGTDYLGLKVAATYQTVDKGYKAFGAQVGKSFDVPKIKDLSFGPVVGVQYFNPQHGAGSYVASAGGVVSYALSKTAAVTLDLTRRLNMDSVNTFSGNQAGLGLAVSF
ncbi:hypothetical protein UFOVP1666_134 [uncultured Caudovirales phage]|uniref:Uncharacterized protein n=1 Tax=uncultured Caudovirales phage TaxID=2100421 RepID=A0A6J5P864_9CAUD|nr:hypothetical protein UFOVP867_89 [uncultured Caudovirales phage]CAB4170785.1 hypothetical protein UFOVP913_109 [uncultured Caudovirales phage]CAB4177082.1 hypothetical protein UFOVP993_162 [uncultured Caudovirales phage]CAB4223110.1 hypothetical protein UFOVP1666_134 [uncultured Caudovirales phage]